MILILFFHVIRTMRRKRRPCSVIIKIYLRVCVCFTYAHHYWQRTKSMIYSKSLDGVGVNGSEQELS